MDRRRYDLFKIIEKYSGRRSACYLFEDLETNGCLQKSLEIFNNQVIPSGPEVYKNDLYNILALFFVPIVYSLVRRQRPQERSDETLA